MAGSNSSAGRAVLWRVAALVKARSLLKTMFSKYLLVTNVTTSFTLAGTGDFMNQRYEKFSNIRTQHNYSRTRNQCIQGVIFGTAYHFWYIFLDRRLPGSTVRVVFKKLLANQIIMIPIGVPVFLGSLGVLEGQDSQMIMDEIRVKGPPLLAVEWTFGSLTQLFNFFFLPTRFRVVYDNTMWLVFDAYYTYVKYRSHLKDGEIMDEKKLPIDL